MNLRACLLAAAVLAASVPLAAQTQVIAHRGYWKAPGSAQNSIRSLQEADRIAVYGSELDIWLSSDGVPVVTHDRTISEDKLVVEDTPAKVLTSLRLANGESVPTLDAYLKAGKACRHTRLVLELKSHSTPERETRLARKVVKMVRRAGLEERVEYIAFSPHMTRELIRLAPGTAVSYLNGDLSPRELKEMGCAGLDYNLNVMKRHEAWFDEARALGLTVNVWTVNAEEDMHYLIDRGVDFITTDEPERLQALLRSRAKPLPTK